MGQSEKPPVGAVTWRDLTVDDASGMRDFYRRVVGWSAADHDMEDYADYEMKDSTGQTVAGICHRRGPNANLPAQWLIYITVADVAASAAACEANGGAVIEGPRMMGGVPFCVIRDPAGAVCALVESV